MRVKDYVGQCTDYGSDELFIDPYGEIVWEIIEERKWDVSLMRQYTTCYYINGTKYAPDDTI